VIMSFLEDVCGEASEEDHPPKHAHAFGNVGRLHKRLPKSALTIFERCGHFCYQDKEVELTELVRTWVNKGHKLG
jgi:pimeloyl-ACP methyl ester carboxylesterase